MDKIIKKGEVAYYVKSMQSFEVGKTRHELTRFVIASSKLRYPRDYPYNDLERIYGKDGVKYMKAYLNQERKEFIKSDKCKMVKQHLSSNK